MIPKMVHYEQSYKGMWKSSGDAIPRDYYDPSIMLADRAYDLKPNEELLVVLLGSGYRYNDDTIHKVDFAGLYSSSNNDEVAQQSSHDSMNFFQIGASHQLCLIVKNCAQNYTFYIGQKSPLQWLLDLPRVRSKLCYCSIADITRYRLVLREEHHSFDEVDCCNSDPTNHQQQQQFEAKDETIVIRNSS